MVEPFGRVLEEIKRVFKGKDEVVVKALACFLSGGHLLLEDIPGVGKTTFALALSRVLNLSFSRVQFTSDLLPSDIIGVKVYDQRIRDFVFKRGPIFTNLLLADEINRATPKTQSALLEAMAERQVSVEGETYPLPEPFFVIATQNPVEEYGTFPLPESQLDRFSMRLSVGYPPEEVEVKMLMGKNPMELIGSLKPVLSKEALKGIMKRVKETYVSEEVARFCHRIVKGTRERPEVILGASTRGAIHLISCAKALAYLKGRDFVVPEDVIELSPQVLGHRIICREGVSQSEVISQILEEVGYP